MLREVLTSCEVSVPAGETERTRVRNITSVPRRGARVTVTRRPAD